MRRYRHLSLFQHLLPHRPSLSLLHRPCLKFQLSDPPRTKHWKATHHECSRKSREVFPGRIFEGWLGSGGLLGNISLLNPRAVKAIFLFLLLIMICMNIVALEKERRIEMMILTKNLRDRQQNERKSQLLGNSGLGIGTIHISAHS